MLKASNFLSLSFPQSWDISFFSVTCEFHKLSIQSMLVKLNYSKQFSDCEMFLYGRDYICIIMQSLCQSCEVFNIILSMYDK